ncbi:MAG: phosphogluconate dehydrogenase (NAD(+)-dependent, decarboxylating) [Syntrophaceae bacterium]|nr:decarboxylating 6-phosphogluconate dehydrogenase [Deltaproteobacteria bacterium]
MELAMVGLGKMGLHMAGRLLEGGHRVLVYDLNAKAMKAALNLGAHGLRNLERITQKMGQPRTVWVMLPAGEPTETTIHGLSGALSPGDIIIDGGNSNYRDTMRRASVLRGTGVHLVDVGTSGGVWGLKEGYSLMIGGEREVVDRLRPLFETLAPSPDRGWGYVGPNGAGHYVKMVHNGIEYGLMEAYAEGFDILKAKQEFSLDLHQIAEIWRHGSVVRSWLLDLTAEALAEDPGLIGFEAWVADSGEGRWTVSEAMDMDVPAPVITLALQMRLVSRHKDSFAAKVLSAMRNKFGGHAIKRAAHGRKEHP